MLSDFTGGSYQPPTPRAPRSRPTPPPPDAARPAQPSAGAGGLEDDDLPLLDDDDPELAAFEAAMQRQPPPQADAGPRESLGDILAGLDDSGAAPAPQQGVGRPAPGADAGTGAPVDPSAWAATPEEAMRRQAMLDAEKAAKEATPAPAPETLQQVVDQAEKPTKKGALRLQSTLLNPSHAPRDSLPGICTVHRLARARQRDRLPAAATVRSHCSAQSHMWTRAWSCRSKAATCVGIDWAGQRAQDEAASRGRGG